MQSRTYRTSVRSLRDGVVILALILSARMSTASEPFRPVADSAVTIVEGRARFTILTPALIRLEWAPDQKFEDRASYAFIHRRLPPPEVRKSTEDGWLILQTRDLTLRYKLGSEAFTPDTLSIELRAGDNLVIWKPNMPDQGNLRGTTRTLDGVSGACPLEPGLISRDGWVLVDDSARPLFDDSDWPWAVARPSPNTHLDWYFFGHGRDYARALRDFTAVAGRIPLPPRYAFGAWWSRYWAYSDQELRELVEEFRTNDVPLDVLVIDMDWHLDGWTGYTWNPKYFPDPAGFLRWLKERGLRVTLNLHPADGVGRHEAAFEDMACALGLDPAKTERIPFASTERHFVEAYFKYLHHPLERMGVDFWWMDWQQGTTTAIPGLDPLPWLNYLHWTDMERNRDRAPLRPMLFSRWGGLGNHRYQIGFSGDTYCDWPSLAFQPYFTATAANVGFTYWSHDIGGHQPGKVDPELYTRWVQWGAFSPALRTHTTKNPQAERRIWKFPPEYFHAMREAFHLRYQLIPYIYTAARRTYDTSMPLVRPLYYAWPELEDAYSNGGQYLFGDQMMIAPVVAERSDWSGCTEQRVWIPPGEWTYWYSGKRFLGPGYATLLVPLEEIPVFTLAGAIIPMQSRRHRVDESPLDPLILHVVNGFSGATSLYEDDGVSDEYQKDRHAWTPFQHYIDHNARHLIIGATRGEFDGALAQRRFEIHFRDFLPMSLVTVNGQPLQRLESPGDIGWWYDVQALTVVVRTPMLSTQQENRVTLHMIGDWNLDEPLATGLRGRLRFAGQLAEEMGAAAPQELRDLLVFRDELAKNPGIAAAKFPTLENQWRAAAAAVANAADWPAERRSAAVVRMLGIPISVRFSKVETQRQGDAAETVVTAEVEAGTPADRESGALRFTLRASADAPWRVAEIRDGHVIELRAAGPPQTGTVRLEIDLSIDSMRVSLPIVRTFFPSINSWWVAGPFDAKYETALQTRFAPEDAVDLEAEYTGRNMQVVRWRNVQRPVDASLSASDEFFVHLHRTFGERVDNAVAYAATYLECSEAVEAQIALGSDDGVVVWLNGVEVHRNDVGRPYGPRQDVIPVSLRPGVNTLLLKISQGGGDWGFGAHIESRDGKPLRNVIIRERP